MAGDGARVRLVELRQPSGRARSPDRDATVPGMRITVHTLSLLPLLLGACPGDDGDPSTTISMTSAASTTDASEASSSTGGTGSTAGSAGSSSEASSAGDTTTGTGPEVCATCDPATEICFASIFDGPTEYSCRPIQPECTADVTCDCITPLECPRSLQSCALEGELVVVECVEG
jgi:hypothetical protein